MRGRWFSHTRHTFSNEDPDRAIKFISLAFVGRCSDGISASFLRRERDSADTQSRSGARAKTGTIIAGSRVKIEPPLMSQWPRRSPGSFRRLRDARITCTLRGFGFLKSRFTKILYRRVYLMPAVMLRRLVNPTLTRCRV